MMSGMTNKLAAAGMVVLMLFIAVPAGSSQEISQDEVGNPSWGFRFKPPAGWTFQQDENGAVLGHETISGMIIVTPHSESSFEAVKKQMEDGLDEEGTALALQGKLQKIGDNAVGGDYSGIYQWQQVKARGIGTFNPSGGGGAYIVALSTPEQFGSAISNAADAIAKAMKYSKVESSETAQSFVGTWTNTTTNTMTNITFAPDGNFYENYKASYSGSSNDQYGDQTMAWGNAGQNQAAGRWKAKGDARKGQIIITYQNGNQTVLEYQVHVENGETYWNEYWFNGALYGRQR